MGFSLQWLLMLRSMGCRGVGSVEASETSPKLIFKNVMFYNVQGCGGIVGRQHKGLEVSQEGIRKELFLFAQVASLPYFIPFTTGAGKGAGKGLPPPSPSPMQVNSRTFTTVQGSH